MELTGKQKSFLRGLGQKLQPSIHIGKAGVTDALVLQIRDTLQRNELIKIHLLPGSGAERRAAAEELALAAGAAMVGVVGRMALLYTPVETMNPTKRIHLPRAGADAFDVHVFDADDSED